jgi:hypothetical protein
VASDYNRLPKSSCRGLKVLVELLDEDCTTDIPFQSRGLYLTRLFVGSADDQHRDLVISALGGIGSVFQLQVCWALVMAFLSAAPRLFAELLPSRQSPTPRNDFCRMFIREGLEDPLSTALSNIIDDNDEGASEAKAQILAVFLLFCQVSQADSRVREALGKRRIIRRSFELASLVASPKSTR